MRIGLAEKLNVKEGRTAVMDRRAFFSRGIRAAVAMGSACVGAVAWGSDISSPIPPKILNYHPAMKYHLMGNTGVFVSEISLGGLVMAESVHRYAIEHGVNLVHVAWDYLGGQSIKTLGAGLKSVRDRIYISRRLATKLAASARSANRHAPMGLPSSSG